MCIGTTLNEKEEDEKGFEWINNSNHPRIYATTAVAEQNALSTFNTNTMFIPKEVLSQPWPNIYAQVIVAPTQNALIDNDLLQFKLIFMVILMSSGLVRCH